MVKISDKKILIVDDDKDFLWILRQSFGNKGFNVNYAIDGETAVALAKKETPDLILLDIQMPGISGLEVAKRLLEAGINSQIIFLTNLMDADNISNAMEISR